MTFKLSRQGCVIGRGKYTELATSGLDLRSLVSTPEEDEDRDSAIDDDSGSTGQLSVGGSGLRPTSWRDSLRRLKSLYRRSATSSVDVQLELTSKESTVCGASVSLHFPSFYHFLLVAETLPSAGCSSSSRRIALCFAYLAEKLVRTGASSDQTGTFLAPAHSPRPSPSARAAWQDIRSGEPVSSRLRERYASCVLLIFVHPLRSPFSFVINPTAFKLQ